MDLYKILDIDKSATITDIKKAYLQMAKKWHPDKSTNITKEEYEIQYNKIVNAYKILSDETKRGLYNESLTEMDLKNCNRITEYSTSDKYIIKNNNIIAFDIESFNRDFLKINNITADKPTELNLESIIKNRENDINIKKIDGTYTLESFNYIFDTLKKDGSKEVEEWSVEKLETINSGLEEFCSNNIESSFIINSNSNSNSNGNLKFEGMNNPIGLSFNSVSASTSIEKINNKELKDYLINRENDNNKLLNLTEEQFVHIKSEIDERYKDIFIKNIEGISK